MFQLLRTPHMIHRCLSGKLDLDPSLIFGVEYRIL